MVALNTFLFILAAVASTSQAGPLKKRIAQITGDSTTAWVQACNAAGGGQQCGQISVNAIATLLAGAGACDQQNAADQMVDLAKSLQNNQKMISLAQVFAQQARNSPNSLQNPYCQQQPKNTELTGLFQCQFQGTKDTFVGNLQAGAPGTVPLGLKSLNVPRSCAANPSGGIADGTQLVAITQDPGLGNIQKLGGSSGGGGGGGSGGAAGAGNTGNSSVTESATATPLASASPAGASDAKSVSNSSKSVDAPNGAAASPSSTPSGSGSGDFHLQNGLDAQKLNAQFATLTPSSSCSTNQDACVQGQFAQCAGGKFQLVPCGAPGGGEVCAALPLVNKAGTSVTCTTTQDALARIAATGAKGGLTGSG